MDEKVVVEPTEIIDSSEFNKVEVPDANLLIQNGIKELRGAISAMFHPESKGKLVFHEARNIFEVLERLNQDASVPDEFRTEEDGPYIAGGDIGFPRRRRRRNNFGLGVPAFAMDVDDDDGLPAGISGLVGKVLGGLEAQTKAQNPISKEAARLLELSKNENLSEDVRKSLVSKAEDILTEDLKGKEDENLDTIGAWGCEPGDLAKRSGMLLKDNGSDRVGADTSLASPEEVQGGGREETDPKEVCPSSITGEGPQVSGENPEEESVNNNGG